MSHNRFRQWHIHRLEHRGPIHAVRSQNILANQMARRGPPVLKTRVIGEIARCRDIIDQRIKPNITDIIFIKRKRNPPFQTLFGARNTQIAQRLAQKSEDLVAPLFRSNKIGMCLDILNEPVLVFAHPEKVILLRNLHRRPPAIRTIPINQILLRPESLIRNTIPPLVIIRINLARIVNALQNLGYNALVPRFGSANKIIMRNI